MTEEAVRKTKWYHSRFTGENQLQLGHTIIAPVRKFLYMHVTVDRQRYEQHSNPTLNENANLLQSQAKDLFFEYD